MPTQQIVIDAKLTGLCSSDEISYGTTIISVMVPKEKYSDHDWLKKYLSLSLAEYNYLKKRRKKQQEMEGSSKIHMFIADSPDTFDNYMATYLNPIVKEHKRIVVVIPPGYPEYAVNILKMYINKSDEEIKKHYIDHCDNVGLCMLLCDKKSKKRKKHWMVFL